MLRRLSVLVAVLATTSALTATVGVNPAGAQTDPVEVGGEALGIFLGDFHVGPVDIGHRIIGGNVSWRSDGAGEPGARSAVEESVAGVSVGAIKLFSNGSFAGHPYAASSVTMTEVNIEGFVIHSLDAFCQWDVSGSSAGTQVAGNSLTGGTSIPPYTRRDIPGVGYVVFNEQGYDDVGGGPFAIWVNAIHVYFTDPTGTAVGDVVVGFASCDPLNLKSLISGGP